MADLDIAVACLAAGITTQDQLAAALTAAKMVADSGYTAADLALAKLQIERNALTTAMASLDQQGMTAAQAISAKKQAVQAQANAIDAQITAAVTAQMSTQ